MYLTLLWFSVFHYTTDGNSELTIGEIVVAAWEDTWYPGEVLEIIPEKQQAIISYMQ